MSRGYLLDGVRHLRRQPSNRARTSWPDDINIVATDAGKIRVKDTGGNKDWSHANTDFETLHDHLPDCDIQAFDGCGHFPYLEQPGKFAALLTSQYT